jgi:hypothetical protein
MILNFQTWTEATVGRQKLIEENQQVIMNHVVCIDPGAGSCKHGNELSDCVELGDILTT